MGDRYTLVPMVKVTPGMVLAYSIMDPPPRRSPLDITDHHAVPPPKALYTGILSPGAKKKLIKAINLLVAIAEPKKAVQFDTGKEFKFRVNFITLTLPAPQGGVTDKDLKQKCLKQWLEYWKDRLPGMSYVWRAERQKNGNLHFHLVTDRYIHYKDIRESWNRCLAPTGLIDAFQAKHGHRHPNSTDVHAVKHVRNLGAYIAKYMSKTESTAQPIDGRVWDCSANLKRKDACAFPASGADYEKLQALMDAHTTAAFATEHCGGVRLTEAEMNAELPPAWLAEYIAYLARVRGKK
jgi:hypothetical protein